MPSVRLSSAPVLLIVQDGAESDAAASALAAAFAAQTSEKAWLTSAAKAAATVRQIAGGGKYRLRAVSLCLTGPDEMPAALKSLRATMPTVSIHWLGRAPLGEAIVGSLAEQLARSPAGAVLLAAEAGASSEWRAEVARLARLLAERADIRALNYAFIDGSWPRLADAAEQLTARGEKRLLVAPLLVVGGPLLARLDEQLGQLQAADPALTIERLAPAGGHPQIVQAIVRHIAAQAEAAARQQMAETHTHGGLSHAHPLAALDAILPPRYRGGVSVSAAPMSAADLVYDEQGQVAWDRVWSGFCELALAGGPPHRGTLLEPVPPSEVESDPEGYARVIAELTRGITMTTGLPVVLSQSPGWIGIRCDDEEMAIWLLRAIIVENVFARREGTVIYLPAGPRFRLEHEIKNVVTAVAKTTHYWTEHRASLGAKNEA
ncbi:MAG: CbiX/SirB N-terminal domain-containing protein [Chloroflexota bacterium]|nr:sirohydrochlorin chelatase [Dehalococcoidia bacterium]MDW8253433.1 CbiX/SirB N-terminal domain-containing protein [Chloroflexota bacterium]